MKKQVYNFVYNTDLNLSDAKHKLGDYATSIQKEINQFEPKKLTFKGNTNNEQKFPFFYHFQLKPINKVLKRNDLPYRVLRGDISWRFKNLIDGEGVVYEYKDESIFEREEVPIMSDLLRANAEIAELKEKLRSANTQILDLQERILQLTTAQKNILEECGMELAQGNINNIDSDNNSVLDMVVSKGSLQAEQNIAQESIDNIQDDKNYQGEQAREGEDENEKVLQKMNATESEDEDEKILQKLGKEEKEVQLMEASKKIKKSPEKGVKAPSKKEVKKRPGSIPSDEKLIENYSEYVGVDLTTLSESAIKDIRRNLPPHQYKLLTIQALKKREKNKNKK
ncbi:MAG: hypothetical protein EOO43_19560 [Flavobacterium sp.]|nr:MAG: hypothetical protein EOO43_19560 [Flavobacterium sp.]